MNNKTKFWLVGGGALCALVIAHCVRKGETPLSVEEADDAMGFPYYLTYNNAPVDTGALSPPTNRGDYVFGDILINGGDYSSQYGSGDSGSGGNSGDTKIVTACCDPCKDSVVGGGNVFSGVINSGLLPPYVSQYISRPLDSLTMPDIVSNSGAAPNIEPPPFLKARVA